MTRGWEGLFRTLRDRRGGRFLRSDGGEAEEARARRVEQRERYFCVTLSVTLASLPGQEERWQSLKEAEEARARRAEQREQRRQKQLRADILHQQQLQQINQAEFERWYETVIQLSLIHI
eukprot:5084479-Pyramimonas_sp.AAC.1